MTIHILLVLLVSLTALVAGFTVPYASRVEPLALRHAPRARAAATAAEPKPTLVVGATGKVGRLVVQELLAQGGSVHALVRNTTKAADVLPAPSAAAGVDAATADAVSGATADAAVSESAPAPRGRLTLFAGDVNDEASLRAAMQGCGAVISVAGTFRVAKLGDFWPWRFFGNACMGWCADLRHPYFVNFLGTQRLVKLAEELQVPKFVRLTGLTQGLPVWHPVSVLFNLVLSMSSKWHGRGEAALRASTLDYTVLRPPGLSDDSMEALGVGMALQLDASPLGTPADAVVPSRIPPASRVGRRNVAKLAVLSLREPHASRRVLTCRWVNGSSSSSSSAETGSSTWAGEFAKVSAVDSAAAATTAAAAARSPNGRERGGGAAALPQSRPYALAVAVVPLLTLVAANFIVSAFRKVALLAFAAAKVV